jgi:hypothetical protein
MVLIYRIVHVKRRAVEGESAHCWRQGHFQASQSYHDAESNSSGFFKLWSPGFTSWCYYISIVNWTNRSGYWLRF